MNRVKFTTTTTGTGDISLTVESGFQTDTASRFRRDWPTGTDYVMYVLLDADGTSWEHGYAQCDGSTLSRSTGTIFESTNSDSQINLSAGTHLVLVTQAGIEGIILQFALDTNSTGKSVTATTYGSSISWTSHNANELSGFNNINGWPGVSLPTLTYSNFYPGNMVPYAKAWRAHLTARCTAGATGDMFGIQIEIQDSNFTYNSWVSEAWAPLISGQLTQASCTTPWTELPSGLNSSTTTKKGPLYYFRNLTCYAHNSSANSITIYPKMIVEFKL